MIITIIVMMFDLFRHYAGTLFSASWGPTPAPNLFRDLFENVTVVDPRSSRSGVIPTVELGMNLPAARNFPATIPGIPPLLKSWEHGLPL